MRDRKINMFPGGVPLDYSNKALTRDLPIRLLPLPARLFLPLQQHIGDPAVSVVRAGDTVLKGQVVARDERYVSAPVHAPTSGRVLEIRDHPLPHPSGLSGPCIVIEVDREDRPCDPLEPIGSPLDADPVLLRNRVREAGIVGMGGAAFPSAVKLNPQPGQKIDTLVINGAECEPYITCDDRLMRERATEIVSGIAIAARILGVERILVGIEDNKPEAIEAMSAALADTGREAIEIIPLPSTYPMGGERQIIYALTGRVVPSRGLPADAGVVCHNVSTVAAIHRAIMHGAPLISRVVTVTGRGVASPGNFEVRIGTPVADLAAAAGGYTKDIEHIILGGPMMGFALRDDAAPVVKGINCLIAVARGELPAPPPALPCIRCGECARVCPMQLLPQHLYLHARARDFEQVQEFSLFDCIECGCCAHVCPSHIPLVQYFRFAKNEVWAQEKEKRRADLARRRHEFRQVRIEREEIEKAQRMAKKKAALAAASEGDDPRKAEIQAAVERAAARKAAQRDTGDGTKE